MLIIIQGLGFVVKQEQPFTWIYQKLPIGYLLRFQFILIIMGHKTKSTKEKIYFADFQLIM